MEVSAQHNIDLPNNYSRLKTKGYGASFWSQSGKIDFVDADERAKSWFIKVSLKLWI